MCLYTKEKKPSVSTEPIVCYKIMVLDQEVMDGAYKTPYTDFLVNKDIIEGKCNMVAEGPQSITKYEFVYSIGSGFIHCYTNKDIAKYDAKSLALNNPGINKIVIFKCEIPVGATYYKSVQWRHEICATEIKFIGKI